MNVNHHHQPVVALSGYTPKERASLVQAAKAAHLPDGTAVYFGSYGISAADAQAAHSIPGGRYAPMVQPSRKLHGAERKLQPFMLDGKKISDPEALLESKHPGTQAYAGKIPDFPKLSHMSPREQVAWGREMGRRIRDEMRNHAQSPHQPFQVDSFQLDEIFPSTAKGGEHSKVALNYLRGVLEGVHLGRPELGDKPMRGLIHIARPLALGQLPAKDPAVRGEYRAFLRALDAASDQVIPEDYTAFSGDPRRAADKAMQLESLFAAQGPHGVALSHKIVAGMTPGLKKGKELGGQVAGQSVSAANRWRDAFEAQAMRDGAVGISEFNWQPATGAHPGANQKPAQMRKVLRGVAKAIKDR